MKNAATKGFIPIWLIILVVFAALSAGGATYVAKKQHVSRPIACTMEAKQCPDGSYVGRMGANCEFAACPSGFASVSPTSVDETANWKTYHNEKYGFEFKLPPDWIEFGAATGEDPVIMNFASPEAQNGSKFKFYGGELNIWIWSNPNNLSIDKFFSGAIVNNNQKPDLYRDSSAGINDIAMNKWTGKRFNGVTGESSADIAVIADNARLIEIENSYREDILNQILSTFKFIEPEGKFCGGIAPGAFPCPSGYECKLDGTYPDAGGHCVKSSTNGTLSGKVSIGPICPVERPGVPCPAPPEAYASREFLVLSADQSKTITSFHADANGSYSVSLPPGTYVVVSAKTGISYMSKDLPVRITIAAGQATTLNIDVDTGIR